MPTKTATRTQETPREKFARLATMRVNKATQAIDQVAHLSNTNIYDYTDEHVQVIAAELHGHVDSCIAALSDRRRPTASRFTLAA